MTPTPTSRTSPLPALATPSPPTRWLPDDPVRALSFGLASPRDLVAASENANAVRAETMRLSSAAALTPRMAWRDASEALTGIPRDLYAGKSVREALTSGDRLRGAGVLLAATALVLLILVA